MTEVKSPGNDYGNNDAIFTADGKFRFSCHEGLQCFKECCRDITILLTPFDIMRMKNKLGLSSRDFLDTYTIKLPEDYYPFPLVALKMDEANDLRCPFISPKGCRVYAERPWSCRMAPVELRGENEYGFCFDVSRCHGLKEAREQNVREWMCDQGLEIYEKMEEGFKEIPLYLRFTGHSDVDKHIRELFYMVCYNLDQFRRFILESSFLDIFNVPSAEVEKIKVDDVELMKFGFKWLKSGIDVKKTMELMRRFKN